MDFEIGQNLMKCQVATPGVKREKQHPLVENKNFKLQAPGHQKNVEKTKQTYFITPLINKQIHNYKIYIINIKI